MLPFISPSKQDEGVVNSIVIEASQDIGDVGTLNARKEVVSVLRLRAKTWRINNNQVRKATRKSNNRNSYLRSKGRPTLSPKSGEEDSEPEESEAEAEEEKSTKKSAKSKKKSESPKKKSETPKETPEKSKRGSRDKKGKKGTVDLTKNEEEDVQKGFFFFFFF